MRPMEQAPKDGTRILIVLEFWLFSLGKLDRAVHLAWYGPWERNGEPTESPRWQTVDMDLQVTGIGIEYAIGWYPAPEELQAKIGANQQEPS